MGLIPVGDLDFFFVPRSCHVEYFIFHIHVLALLVQFVSFSIVHVHSHYLVGFIVKGTKGDPKIRGGGAPLYGLYRYVRPKGYGFSSILVINRVLILADFGHFGHK